MIDGVFVCDAVVHGFNFRVSNLKQPFMGDVVRSLYHWAFDSLHPIGDSRYHISFEQFQDAFDLQPDLLETVLFGESQTDIACYHGVPMYGLFGDGSSPVDIGEAIAERFPHRMFIYGDISPTHSNPMAWIDELVTKQNLLGVKFYPLDMVEGRVVPVQLNDEKNVMPLIERLRDRGVKVVAVHKAVPLGPLQRPRYHLDDMAPVLTAFPDMQFEIVHGGFAFADETARLLAKYDNVWVNLESLPCFALNHADKFAEMLDPLLATGRHDRIFYATGATGMHPQPFINAFWQMRMPAGFAPLTEEMKAGMLGANFARLHGLEVEALLGACRQDRFGVEDKRLETPWSLFKGNAQEVLYA